MRLDANQVRSMVDRVQLRLGNALPIASTEYGLRTGDWNNDEDYCIWLAGYGVRPTTITTRTLAGDNHYQGYEVLYSKPVNPGPFDDECPPEPELEPLESFASADMAIAFMVGRAVGDWALRHLQTSESDPLYDIPAFLRRQAD